MAWRDSPQPLLPKTKPPLPEGAPDIYPGNPIVSGKIELGFSALAQRIADQPLVLIDGYCGIFWEDLRAAAGSGRH